MDIGWKFPPSFSEDQTPKMVSQQQDIRESLEILLTTQKGERVLQPEYGCNLKRLMYSNMDSFTKNEVKREITKAVMKYEPRVTLEDVQIDETAIDQIKVLVIYKINAFLTSDKLELPYYIA